MSATPRPRRKKPLRGQSTAARLERLMEGRCPVHGRGMMQITRCEHGGEWYELVACACGIQGITTGPDAPVRLLPEWQHLISGEGSG